MPDTEFAISADAGAERYDRWREALADAFGPFEVHHGKPAQFAGHVRARASLQFNDLHYQGQQLERTAGNVSRLDQSSTPSACRCPARWRWCSRAGSSGRAGLRVPDEPEPALPATALGAAGYRSLSVSFPRSAVAARFPHRRVPQAAHR